MPNRSLTSPIATDPVEKAPIAVTGITAAELARRVRVSRRSRTFGPDELARWLVAAGFAEQRGELLWATELGIEVGGKLVLPPEPD